MKDLHNHILYGIDDGSKDLISSIKLLKEMSNEGVEEIILTPHYIIGSEYNADNNKKKRLLRDLKPRIKKMKLYIGNEVFLDHGILDYIKSGEISTLNNSRYLLIEFPMNEKMNTADVHLENLIRAGIVPVIAHPERYHYYKLKDFEKFIEMGCLLQGNITSLINKYGKKSKNNLELLLKKDMIHLLGTDTHRTTFNIKECELQLQNIVSKSRYKELTKTNFDKVIKIMQSDKKSTSQHLKFILPTAYATVIEYDFTPDELKRIFHS